VFKKRYGEESIRKINKCFLMENNWGKIMKNIYRFKALARKTQKNKKCSCVFKVRVIKCID